LEGFFPLLKREAMGRRNFIRKVLNNKKEDF
jgi:hypothetical protein